MSFFLNLFNTSTLPSSTVIEIAHPTQPAFTCSKFTIETLENSKFTIETLEKGVKYVQS